MKAKTRSLLSICLAVVLVASAVFGTIAYMTATAEKENVFTVGTFGKPTTDPTDPTQTIEEGYIHEPSWVENSKLVSGSSTAKDPYIGIGKGSDPAVVYVYIENKMADAIPGSVYFKLNDGWTAVEGKATAVTVNGETYYTGGLFKYTGTLTPSETADDWTDTPVFSEVITAADADVSGLSANPDSLKMIVHAFIHQATDAEGTAIDSNIIETAAKDWADGLTTGA